LYDALALRRIPQTKGAMAMNYSAIPGPGDVATWPTHSAGFEGDHPYKQEARDHLLACSADWQEWLAEVSRAREGAAFSTILVREEDMDSVCVDTLLACLLSGTRAQSEAARYELQSRFLRDSADRLRRLEDQLCASQQGDPEPEFYDDF
jgi:hypothetical protein